MCLGVVLLASLLLIAGPTQAEEIWVRNQPFSGRTHGSGSTTLVELRLLAQNFKLGIEVREGRVFIGNNSVRIQEDPDGTAMVSLYDFSQAAGLKLRPNPHIGTIDVHAAAVGTGQRGDWSTVGAKRARTRSKSARVKYDGGTYTLRLPAKAKMMDDPARLRRSERGGSTDGSELRFRVTLKDGSDDAVLVLMTLRGLPTNMSPDSARAMTSRFRGGMAQRGEVLEEPTELLIGQHKFFKATHRESDKDGATRIESYVNWSNGQGIGYVLMLSDNQKTFHRSAVVLRSVVKSMRIKRK